jgi:hypothetical protein
MSLSLVSIILPVFLLMGLGYVLRSKAIVGDGFFLHDAHRFFYLICLPCLLFVKTTAVPLVVSSNAYLEFGSVGCSWSGCGNFSIIHWWQFCSSAPADISSCGLARGLQQCTYAPGAILGIFVYLGVTGMDLAVGFFLLLCPRPWSRMSWPQNVRVIPGSPERVSWFPPWDFLSRSCFFISSPKVFWGADDIRITDVS